LSAAIVAALLPARAGSTSASTRSISGSPAAGAAACPGGPLDLDLLGLVVELNRVHLTIVAIPGGGVPGNLFCGLSTQP
jgi:hypothetical protein